MENTYKEQSLMLYSYQNLKNIPINSGIYKILNIINTKVYIGSSTNLRYRISKHFNHLKKNHHNNDYLQRSFNKWGKDSFIFEILELCPIMKLQEREQFYMEFYNACNKKSGYNIKLKANNTGPLPLSVKNKISVSNTGSNNPMYGKHHTLEVIEQARMRQNILLKQKDFIEKIKHSNQEHYKNLSQEEKEKLNKNKSDGWKNMSEENKKNWSIYCSNRFKKLPIEKQKELCNKMNDGHKKYLENMNTEERRAFCERQRINASKRRKKL